MASRHKKTENDFENRFFDLLETTIEGVDKKVDKIDAAQAKQAESQRRLEDTQKTVSHRLGRLERKVFPNTPSTVQQLAPFWRDPAIIKLFTLIAAAIFVFLVIIAGLRGYKIPFLGGL